METEFLCELFKTEERIRILRYIAREQEFSSVSVVEATETSKGHVSKYLNLLARDGLVVKEGRRYRWVENAVTRQVKKVLNIDLLRGIDLPSWADGIGVYGSVAEGRDRTGSDLDIWVLVEKYDDQTEINAARLERTVTGATGMEAHILLLTGDQLEALKETDVPFYEKLMRQSMVLKGEDIEDR